MWFPSSAILSVPGARPTSIAILRLPHRPAGRAPLGWQDEREMTVTAGLPDAERRWALLVPLKPLASAKSRLQLPAEVRTPLVLAMACDTVEVALACPLVDLVLVVAEEVDGLEPLQRLGAGVVVDPSRQGLNAALRHAAAIVAARDSGYGIAALVADVAAVTVDQLTRVLIEASHHLSSFVPDAAGQGTTFVAATQWGSFLPEYGPQSRRRHAAAGLVELVLPDITGLRLDVDTTVDLQAAAAIGAGPRTQALLESHLGRPLG